MNDPKELLEQYTELLAMVDLLKADRETAIRSILTKAQGSELAAIHDELDDQIEDAGPIVAQAKKNLGEAIIKSGAGLKTKTHTVSLVKGRPKWDDEMLRNLAFEYPEILTARSQGDPYVVVKVRR